MFSLLMNASKLLGPYRVWISAGLITLVIATAAIFYGNCRANATALEGANGIIQDLRLDLSAAHVELSARNERIQSMNDAHLIELAAARDLLQKSLMMSEAIRQERDLIREDLKVTQYELLEAIKDDEEMADWVDWTVPSSAWGLLRDAVEGTGSSGVRTDD